MKALIACLVILTSLSSAVETASDFHFSSYQDGCNPAALLGDSVPDDAPADREACDHCCHAGGQVIGLTVAVSAIGLTAASDKLSEGSSIFRSRAQSPPTPPPNV